MVTLHRMEPWIDVPCTSVRPSLAPSSASRSLHLARLIGLGLQHNNAFLTTTAAKLKKQCILQRISPGSPLRERRHRLKFCNAGHDAKYQGRCKDKRPRTTTLKVKDKDSSELHVLPKNVTRSLSHTFSPNKKDAAWNGWRKQKNKSKSTNSGPSEQKNRFGFSFHSHRSH